MPIAVKAVATMVVAVALTIARMVATMRVAHPQRDKINSAARLSLLATMIRAPSSVPTIMSRVMRTTCVAMAATAVVADASAVKRAWILALSRECQPRPSQPRGMLPRKPPAPALPLQPPQLQQASQPPAWMQRQNLDWINQDLEMLLASMKIKTRQTLSVNAAVVAAAEVVVALTSK